MTRWLAAIGVVVFALGCSSAAETPQAGGVVAASTSCAPGTWQDCDCGGRVGTSTCNSDGKRGACDCSVTRPPGTPIDGGPEPETCTTPTAWHRDNDGDGHGSGVVLSSCAQPPGWVESDDDCDDTNANVFPGQTAYFTTPRSDGSYDYDCDKNQTRKHESGGGCHKVNDQCNASGSTNYWRDSTIPACGQTAPWILVCQLGCIPSEEQRTQPCR